MDINKPTADLQRALEISNKLKEKNLSAEQIDLLEQEALAIFERTKEFLQPFLTQRRSHPFAYWSMRIWLTFKQYWTLYIQAALLWCLAFTALVSLGKVLLRCAQLIWNAIPI